MMRLLKKATKYLQKNHMSKIKLGKTGIDFIKEWVIKTALKQQPKGVLTTLPKKDFVDLNTAITAERLMRNGVDPNAIKNIDQVDNIIDQLNKPRVVAADSPEGKGITESLLGKKGEVFNLQGEKLDPSKPIVGGTQQGKKINREFFERNAEAKEVQKRIDSGVASTVEKMLGMEPIDAMKEANKVIGRKGEYKNLSQEDAKKILQDTEDHIFERNVDIDPEDMFADGGRIGFKGGADMGTVSGDTRKATAKSVSVSPTGNVTTSRDKGPDPVDDRSTFEQTINQRNIKDKPKNNPIKDVIQAGANFNYLSNLYNLNPQGIATSFLLNKMGDVLFPNEEEKANGGRIGFKKGMDRRTFMKFMAGLTTLPVVGKFFKGAEVAAPVVEKAAEVASGAPPYFFNLVNRIRALGKQSPGPKERSEAYTYEVGNRKYEMQVDNDTGQIEISKQNMGYDERFGEGIVSEEYMTIRPGRVDETTKGKRTPDEYEEYTGFTDQEGKLKDVEPGISDNTVMDGSISKEELEQEIIEQLSKEAPSIKKAGGGIARMLGE